MLNFSITPSALGKDMIKTGFADKFSRCGAFCSALLNSRISKPKISPSTGIVCVLTYVELTFEELA